LYLKAPSHTKDAFINGRKHAPFVLDAESSFVLSTSSTFHLSPWEIRPGPGKKGLNPIHITTQNGMDLPSILIF
jgi:hypothetical protein